MIAQRTALCNGTGQVAIERLESSDDRLDDLARDVREAESPAVVAVRQPLVIDPEQVQDRRVQVVDVDGVDGGRVADLVGCAVTDAALDAAAGQPDGERAGIVIAAGLLAGLGDRQPAELAAPDHQGLVEQPALFEVLQQAGDRLIGLAGELLVVALDVDVAVPGELVLHAARNRSGRSGRRARPGGGP